MSWYVWVIIAVVVIYFYTWIWALLAISADKGSDHAEDCGALIGPTTCSPTKFIRQKKSHNGKG